MKNKVIIDLLERLIYYVRKDNLAKLGIYHQMAEDDYVRYVEGVIEGFKESRRDEAVKNIKDAIKHNDKHEAIMEYIDKKFDKLAKKFIKVWE